MNCNGKGNHSATVATRQTLYQTICAMKNKMMNEILQQKVFCSH